MISPTRAGVDGAVCRSRELLQVDLAGAAVEVALALRAGVLDHEPQHAERRGDQQRRDDAECVVTALAPAGPATLVDRLDAEERLDDRLLEAEVALAADGEQLLRAP